MIEYFKDDHRQEAQLVGDTKENFPVSTIELSTAVIAEARQLLEAAGSLEGPVHMPSRHEMVNVVISPKKEDMIVLTHLVHQDKVYYLGLPKDLGRDRT